MTDPLFGDLDDDLVQRVFKHWQHATGRFTNRLTIPRRKKIVARLQDSTFEEIIAAIDACTDSVWHMDRGFNDLPLILRSRDKLEEFVERGAAKQRNAERTYRRHDPTVYDRSIKNRPA